MIIIRREGRDKKTYREAKRARAIKTEGYLKSIQRTSSLSREFYRRVPLNL